MFVGESWLGSTDLSKATKLQDIVFTCGSSPQWTIMTLRTITPNHRNLRQISLSLPFGFCSSNHDPTDLAYLRRVTGEMAYAEWLKLDHLIAQLWESHSIRARIPYSVLSYDEIAVRRFVGGLLPEVTAGGVADFDRTP
jgi:hypothetical protein